MLNEKTRKWSCLLLNGRHFLFRLTRGRGGRGGGQMVSGLRGCCTDEGSATSCFRLRKNVKKSYAATSKCTRNHVLKLTLHSTGELWTRC